MTLLRPIDPLAEAGALLELWNSRIGSSFPLDRRLLAQQLTLERGPKICLGAYEGTSGGGERLVGAALAKLQRVVPAQPATPAPLVQGYLSFIVVDEAASRRGMGTALLERAEAWLVEAGATRLNLGRDSYHFFPGIPLDGSPASQALAAFAAARGFDASADSVEEDLIADLRGLDLAALTARAPMAQGYRIRPYDEGLRDGTLDFLSAEFPGRWTSDTLEALEAGMRGRDLVLLMEESSGRVVGFSRIYDKDSPVLGPGVYWRNLMGDFPGGLGPIGVSKSVRGKGLGLALLRSCIEELAGRGVGNMVIDWTGLRDFYGKMGFRPWKAYRLCSKPIGVA
jgi:Predicted acetyltransferase